MIAKSVSVKVFTILAAFAAMLAASLLCGVPQAHAASYSYVERHWDGARVAQVTKTANCYVIDDDTTVLEDGAWYVVNSKVNSNERLIVKGTANIILCDGARLYLEDGINVPAGKTLNIYGQGGDSGELYCDADTNDNAAIGANDEKGACGTINFHGGKVTANTKDKGTDGAGIGGGDEGDGGNVTIYGGEVTAIGAGLGAGIGGGDRDGNKGGNNGTTTIYGGTVKATGGSSAAGIGGGELGSGGTVVIKGGDVTATGGTDAAGIGGGMKGSGGTITIEGGKVNATGGSANSNGGAGIGGGGAGSSGTITIHDGNVTARGGANAAGIGGGDEGSAGTITITGGTVNATGGSVNYDGGAGIGGGNGKGGGEVTIRGGNVTAQGGCDAAGIGGGDGGGGTVYVINGTVNATGGKYGAGIGGGQDFSGNTIRIQGGTVNATGGSYGAGLGGGQRGSGGTITITDGTVTATGGTDSAGIGAGEDGNGGTINIQRGNVTAYGGAGGAGIGGGDGVGATNAGNSGDITISGGEVTATGGEKGAGIGGGNSGDNDNKGTIAISGGKVIATGGGQDPNDENPKGAAAIGGGNAQSGGTINITGGDVTARASYRSAGIGGGGEASGGNITITGGTVKAYGGAQGKKYSYIYPEGGAGIGGGYKNDGGTITIGGDASVVARGTEGAAGIGGGRQGKSGTIVINGGTVDAGTGHGGAGIGSGFICRDSGTTVNVTINGGTVKAVGGESQLQTDAEVGKYFWSHPGAGIGAGGCSDYMQKDDREYHSYFTGSINLNGGTIDAYVGSNDLGLSNTVIGGIELGDTATITVKGGCTVKVHQNGANDPGKALLKATEVKLEDADGYSSCVRNLTNPSEIASTDQRVEWCKRQNTALELLIEPCKHESAIYSHTDTNHSMTCPHCTRSYSEAHKFGEPEWEWMEGYQSATVKIACACGYAPKATATITKNHSEGNTMTGTQDTITAKATINGKEYTEVEVGPQAQIATLPSAVQGLVYDGRGHALVTGGRASAGNMQYQLGENDTTAPTGEWSDTIPAGTDAGPYYVWSRCYMGKDGLVSTTEPTCVQTTITRAPSPVRVAEDATVQNGGSIDLADYVKMNGAKGDVTYSVDTSSGCAISEGKLVVENNAQEGKVTVNVSVASDANYEALETSIKVTVTSKIVVTIDAKDVETTFSEGGKVPIDATVIGADPNKDYGRVSYATDPPTGNEYLASDENMSNTLTIKKAGTTYVTVGVGENDTYAAVVKDVKVTIKKAPVTPSVTLEDWTYGDTANTPALTEGSNPGEGAVTYEYKAKDAAEDTYTTTVPDQAGSYVVRATVAETDNYLGATTQPVEFSIAPREMTIAADNKSSKYEEEIAELTYGLSSGALAKGDSIESLGITASTTATNKSTIGDYPITLSGGTANPNYNVMLVVGTYTIAKNDPVVVVPVPRNLTYSSKPQTLVSSGFATGGTIQFSLDGETFSDDMPAGTNAGNYDVWYRVAGDANHSDIEPQQLTATIAPANISGATVELAQQSFVYDGSAKEPAVTITVDDMTLGDDDYSVSYSANTDAGEASATATCTGNYTGSVTVGFEITAADISKATVELAQKSYVHDGSAKEPAAKVTLEGKTLVAGTDYDVAYKDNVDVGTATVTVTGRGNYVGSAKAEFAIEEPAAGGVTMHRLYNPNSGEHFFTASEHERDAVVAAGWTYEGEGWTAPETGDPVYRLYNPNAGEHHYTRSAYERDHLVSVGWKDEGTGWLSAGDDGVPLLRVYNPNAFANNHHYTASAAERDWLVSLGWSDEGTGWYGL